MIEQITDNQTLENLLYQSRKNDLEQHKGYWVRANLTFDIIEQWKQNGYFRHIKSQLQNVHGIKFACSQHEKGCEYYFILPSKALKNRVYHMLNTLYTFKKKEPLVNMKTDLKDTGCQIEHVSGQVKACMLF